MGRVRIEGKNQECIEISFSIDLNSTDSDIELHVCSGAWTSIPIPHFVETNSLVSFLDDLKSIDSSSKHGASLQSESDMVYIRVALSKDKNQIWVYGHVKEMNHKNEFKFSFDGWPTSIRLV